MNSGGTGQLNKFFWATLMFILLAIGLATSLG
jgi:hypothetical protein